MEDVEFGKVFVAEQGEFDRVSEKFYKMKLTRCNQQLEIFEHNEY